MKVRVIRSFATNANGHIIRYTQGQEIELPAGRGNWLLVGFVEPLPEPERYIEVEDFTYEPPEAAVVIGRKRRGRRSKQ